MPMPRVRVRVTPRGSELQKCYNKSGAKGMTNNILPVMLAAEQPTNRCFRRPGMMYARSPASLSIFRTNELGCGEFTVILVYQFM